MCPNVPLLSVSSFFHLKITFLSLTLHAPFFSLSPLAVMIDNIDTRISRCYAHDGSHTLQQNLTDDDG